MRGGAIQELQVSRPGIKTLRNFAAPACILGLALLLSEYLPKLPGPLAALKSYGPPLVLIAGALVSLSFKRGRALFAILSLAVAYIVFRVELQREMHDVISRTLYAAVWILVPFNFALYSLVQERGALNAYGVRRFALIVLECLVVLWFIRENVTAVTDLLLFPVFGGRGDWDAHIPQLGLVITAFALLVTTANAIARNSAVDAAFSAAIVAFAVACAASSAPDGFAIYIAAAGGMLTVGVLQDSHRMAFQDDLTGLPGRRALNERMLSLVGHYTIAMVDIDHFKSFNDRWGHDVGDQVLKLVASHLRHPGRGGAAYRYGGEEFAILFPGKRLMQVLPRLQALCHDIATYRFLMREGRRFEIDGVPARALVTDTATRTPASVTVSIGVAERSHRHATPTDVINAADAALYRAKAEGRNRVCR